MRQITKLDFVSFIENVASSTVVIDSTGVAAGGYTLTFESYNALSTAQSALMTDTISITINELVPPSFLSELETQIVTAGTGASWILPDIDPGSA